MAVLLATALSLLGLTLYGKMQACCRPSGAADAGQALIDWVVDNGGTVREIVCLRAT